MTTETLDIAAAYAVEAAAWALVAGRFPGTRHFDADVWNKWLIAVRAAQKLIQSQAATQQAKPRSHARGYGVPLAGTSEAG